MNAAQSLIWCLIMSTFTGVISDKDRSLREKLDRFDRDGKLRRDSVMVIIFLVFISLILRCIIRILKLSLPYQAFTIIIGLTIGGLLPQLTKLSDSISILSEEIPPLSVVILPILTVHGIMATDEHLFYRCLPQIFVVAIPVFLVSSCLTGLTITTIINPQLPFLDGFFFGALCSSTYPIKIYQFFRDNSKTKYMNAILNGESIIGTSVLLTIYKITITIAGGYVGHWYHIILLIVRFLLGGLLVGWLISRILSYSIEKLAHDPVHLILVNATLTCLIYFVVEKYLGLCGVLTSLMIGTKMSVARGNARHSEFVCRIWDILVLCTETAVYSVVSIHVGVYGLKMFEVYDISILIITYVISAASRFVSYLLFAPILSRIGYGMTFKHMVLMVWGGIHGIVPWILLPLAIKTNQMSDITDEVVFYIPGITLLSLVINVTSMPPILRILGYLQISVAKQQNMNICMRHLENKRQRAISLLKTDRFIADANWPVVKSATALRHPYMIDMDEDEQEENALGYNIIICPDCLIEIPNEPTMKEMIEMTREARIRILKALNVSFYRQYENGTLMKENLRILNQAVEVAMDTDAAIIEIDELQKLFHKNQLASSLKYNLVKWIFNKTNVYNIPKGSFRQFCYKMVDHLAFRCFINCVIVLNVLFYIFELSNWIPSLRKFTIYSEVMEFAFFLIYLGEFTVTVLAYSTRGIGDGLRTYFASLWNCYDFIVLCASAGSATVILLKLQDINVHETYYVVFRSIEIMRTLRLLRLCSRYFDDVGKYVNISLDQSLAPAYDLGKGYVMGLEDVLDELVQMIDTVTIREKCRDNLEKDRHLITSELNLVQKNRPSVAITVKTVQAIRTVLNTVKDGINELKVSGWADVSEYKELMESLSERFKYCQVHVHLIQPNSPTEIFNEIPWMSGSDKITEFLNDNVISITFDEGDIVCKEGELCEGIFIIVAGMLKITYVPKKDTLQILSKFGALPVVDSIYTDNFELSFENYVLSGNCVGELGTLTKRPYASTVVSETVTQVYLLTRDVMEKAFQRSPDKILGLQARIWKSISTDLATHILMKQPFYKFATRQQILFNLEPAIVPNISDYKVFKINSLMEDVLLLEGVAVDYITRTMYIGPVYIPRTVQRLILPKSSVLNFQTTIETKLMVIPVANLGDVELLEEDGEVSELVQFLICLEYLCTRHSIRKGREKVSKFLPKGEIESMMSENEDT